MTACRCERCHNLLSDYGRFCERCLGALGGRYDAANERFIVAYLAEAEERLNEVLHGDVIAGNGFVIRGVR